MSLKLNTDRETTSHLAQIVKRFSMYIYLRDDCNNTKTSLVQEYDRVLQEFMTYLVECEPNTSEEYWARSFLRILIKASHLYLSLLINKFPVQGTYYLLISSELCQQLLISYLQLICFYAAKQMSNQLKNSPSFKLHYPIEECFIIACEASLKPGRLLKNFDFSANFPLYGYARKALNRTIKNQVVKDFKIRSIKLSDYSLLNSLSPTQLERYLKNYGISSAMILKYRLVCQIFQELFLEFFPPDLRRKRQRKVIKCLSKQQLKQISLIYNQRLPSIDSKIEPSNQEDIKQMLATCIKAARSAQQRQSISLEEKSLTINLIDPEPDQLLQAEKQIHLQELKDVILTSFHALDRDAQTHLLLWLGLEINQADFIAALNLQKQYQVARYFQRYQKKILKQVIQVLIPKYLSNNISVHEINQLCSENLGYIKEYLHNYGRDFLGKILSSVIKNNLSSSEQEMLIKHSTDQLSFRAQDAKIYQKLKPIFQAGIEHELAISLNQFSSTEKYLTKFIEKWIQQNLAFLYQL